MFYSASKMLYLGGWFLAADCVSVLSIRQNMGLEETHVHPIASVQAADLIPCLFRSNYLEVFRMGRAVICKGQEHAAFKIINSYSSSLQGKRNTDIIGRGTRLSACDHY